MNAAPRNGASLPRNLDAEMSILGGILLKNEVLERIDTLEVDDFFDHKNKVVFQAMRNLVEVGRPIDIVTLEAEIAKSGELDAIGGVAYLGELTLRVPTADNVAAYAEIVRDKHLLRKMMVRAGSIIAHAPNFADQADEYLTETIADLQRIAEDRQVKSTQDTADRQRWCVPLVEFLGEQEPDDDDRADWIVRDVLPRGEAGILAGPPKCGKTWAMLDLGICVALGRPWMGTFDNTMGGPAKVLALAFEDGQRRLRKRVWELSRTHGLTPNDKTLQAHLSVSREPLALPGDERALAAELKAWKPSLVLIDNLTRVMAGDQNAIKDAKRFSDLWCRLCTDVGAAIVFLHHTSKVGPIRPDQRNAGDPFELIRGSGDLVASARHLVLMRPLESPDDDKLADVRMRGNLDLHREDFVFGFQRERLLDRWTARLGFRGDGEAVRDELAEKRREKQAARKDARTAARGGETPNSVDERVYAKIASMVAGGARDLCTLEQLRQSCGVRQQEVRPSLDRLIHAGRVRTDTVRRHEGTSWRSRAIFVPNEGGG